MPATDRREDMTEGTCKLTCSKGADEEPEGAGNDGTDPAPGGPDAVLGAVVAGRPLVHLDGRSCDVADQDAHRDDSASCHPPASAS